jgi:hypothetical protein
MPDKLLVFLSHASQDKPAVRRSDAILMCFSSISVEKEGYGTEVFPIAS